VPDSQFLKFLFLTAPEAIMQFKKALLTAGAVGVLGTAGTFGTFAAFTATDAKDLTVTSGTVQIENTVDFASLANLGTSDQSMGTLTNADHTALDKQTGSITIKNTGSLPQDFYIDFDGPGVADQTSPNVGSTNLLAENIKVDTSGDAFTTQWDDGTRLWQLNRRGLTRYFANVPAGESRTLSLKYWLRERVPTEYAGGDNEMQGLSLSNEKVTVKAIEAGADDFAAETGYDNGN
jgi:hypothetical protein